MCIEKIYNKSKISIQLYKKHPGIQIHESDFEIICTLFYSELSNLFV
jgi:hypothetical protein